MMGAKNLPVMAYRLMQVVAFGIAVVASSFAQSSSQSMGLPDLLKAAESGDAGAQTELGRRYEYGLGVPEDHLAAAKWFRKAAEQGNAKAQRWIPPAAYRDQGVCQNQRICHGSRICR